MSCVRSESESRGRLIGCKRYGGAWLLARTAVHLILPRNDSPRGVCPSVLNLPGFDPPEDRVSYHFAAPNREQLAPARRQSLKPAATSA